MRKIFVFLAVVAGLQGAFFLTMAISDLISVAAQGGLVGPADVSNPQAFTTLVVLFVLFGLGMLAIAWGWLRHKRWARGPFVVMQVLVLVVAVPSLTASDTGQRVVALIAVPLAAAGIIAAVTPPVTRTLYGD